MDGDFYVGRNWLVQPSLNRISGSQDSHRLPKKYMQVLLCLAERPGETVTREHLMDTVWQETIVGEESLTRAISELRKIFDDPPGEPRVIETIPKVGYRLIAPVSPVTEAAGSGRTEVSGGDFIPKPRSFRSVFGLLFLVLMGITVAFAAYLFRSIPQGERHTTRTIPLTSYPGVENQPALSPDGNRLAFVAGDERGRNSDLYIKTVSQEQPIRLTYTSGGVSDPAWSEDGRYLAFIKHAAEGCKIFSLSPLGGPERPLVSLPRDRHPLDPAWSPDGKWLAYAVQDACQPPNGIYLLSFESHQTRLLTGLHSAAAQDRRPVFSPDGKRLAFIRVASGKTDIYVIPVSGKTATRLSHGEHFISDLDWTPDGKHIVFASREGLWQIPASGGHPSLLVAGTMSRAAISIARESWRLAYEQTGDERNIWQMSLSGAAGKHTDAVPLIASTRSDADPAVSRDGTRIAFVSDRAGEAQLWVCDRSGDNARQLTHFEECRIVNPSWSPDGNRIAFAADPDGQLDIYLAATRTGEVRRLTTATANDDFPNWSQNGSFLYFGSDRSGRWDVYKIGIDNRQVVQVTRKGGGEAMESPDGRDLYYARSTEDTTEIRRIHLDSNEPEDVLLRLPGGYRADWEVGRHGIYYSEQNEACNLTIHCFSLATHQSRTLFQTDKSSFNFTVTPDGKTLLFDQSDRSESDIVLLDNFRSVIQE